MQQGLSLRVSQHLALTPQLQQSIRLLQLSTAELEQEVGQMLESNPFLEQAASDEAEPASEGEAGSRSGSSQDVQGTEALPDAPPSDTPDIRRDEDNALSGTSEELDWGEGASVAVEDGDWGAAVHSGDGDTEAGEWAASLPTLRDHLHEQVLRLRIGDADRAALGFLIDSLDDNGYLEDDPDVLAQSLSQGDADVAEALRHHFTVAWNLLRHLDPIGVGARNLAECLRWQLEALWEEPDEPDRSVVNVALRLCTQPLEWLARKDLKRLVATSQAGEDAVRAALALIAKLEPQPGRRFADVRRAAIIPDVIVVRKMAEGTVAGSIRFEVQLNPEVVPQLRIHSLYAQALRSHRTGVRDDGGVRGLEKCLQEARWFVKNVQQRFETILRVSRAIVEHQKGFLLHGELAMRPLILRDIADELGLHESTISRVTNAKYIATPQGTFELKHFFGSGLGTQSGSSASSTAVRALIKQWIAEENPAAPLSDGQIADQLQERGIACARRTVAKYREGLHIPPAPQRKPW
ncbi:RNA polymerase factor sigma-54 [Candidatus Symbiobacter mobilis]|uniref:RNA polymerase sigma-54 factor n=1 Tax=Candidatus Symbiobacter mobilis CR TaxID=946483 RepID=U5N9Q3_9BURK|nr:RNA polymerase factor sigma-54 [Candidatus Symbiobacter mobilis]AGX86899.1 RNA polymerase sigma-54 factor [Candidatus Symbiobacter mobilis CR]